MRTLFVTSLMAAVTLLGSGCNRRAAKRAEQPPVSKRKVELADTTRLPTETLMYGSISSVRLIEHSKDNLRMYGGAHGEKNGREFSWDEYKVVARDKGGIDFDKMGRVTIVGMALTPPGMTSASFEMVVVMSSAAYDKRKLKRVGEVVGTPVYAMPGATVGRVAFVGKTVMMGSVGVLRHVLEARNGSAPRLVPKAPMNNAIRLQRLARPGVSSFVVIDIPGMYAKFVDPSRPWRKELQWLDGLTSAGIFLLAGETEIRVTGTHASVVKGSTFLNLLLRVWRKKLSAGLPQIKQNPNKMVRRVMTAMVKTLGVTTVAANGGTLVIRAKVDLSRVTATFSTIAQALQGKHGAPNAKPK